MPRPITAAQLRCLQVQWSQRMKQAGIRDAGESREMRHEFIRVATAGRAAETRELTAADAKTVLRLLSGQATLRIADHGLAQAAGTHGRRGHHDRREEVLAGPDQLALIATLQAALGWDQARLDGFIARQLRGRPIRTMADANRVGWPMKRMIRAARVQSTNG